MSGTPSGLLVAGVCAAVVLAGCTAGDPEDGAGASTSAPSASPSASAAAPTVRPAVEPPRPRKGRCYRLAFADALASTSDVPASSCERRHTSLTYAVGSLDTVVDGHLLAVDSRRAQDQLAAECPRLLARFLGGDAEELRLSMLRPTWFGPTLQESAEGADWFRCDVIAVTGDQELARLEGRLRGILGRPADAESYAMCGTADPEDPDFVRVLCAETHSWQAISTVEGAGLSRGGDFPGVPALRENGQGACEDAARAVAPDPLTVTWSYEPPTRGQWRTGQRYGICWVPSTS